MPNWPLNMDVVCHVRAYRVPFFYKAVLRVTALSTHTLVPSHLTHRDMGNIIDHVSTTFGHPVQHPLEAIDNHEAKMLYTLPRNSSSIQM